MFLQPSPSRRFARRAKFERHLSPPSIHDRSLVVPLHYRSDNRFRYVQRSFVACDGDASVARAAVFDSAGHEERDANARYKLLLDIQDVFSTSSGLVTSITAGSKEHHHCFSGAAFMKWLRDEGGKHLHAHSVDFSHEGILLFVPASPATQHDLIRRLVPTCPRNAG